MRRALRLSALTPQRAGELIPRGRFFWLPTVLKNTRLISWWASCPERPFLKKSGPWLREQSATLSEIHASSIWALLTVKGDTLPPSSLPHAFCRVSGNRLTGTERLRLLLLGWFFSELCGAQSQKRAHRPHRQGMQHLRSWIIESLRAL